MKYCLLDYLTEQTSAQYISELKNKNILKQHVALLQAIREDTFSLEDWCDVCNYLTGDTQNITSVHEAKEKLIAWIAA